MNTNTIFILSSFIYATYNIQIKDISATGHKKYKYKNQNQWVGSCFSILLSIILAPSLLGCVSTKRCTSTCTFTFLGCGRLSYPELCTKVLWSLQWNHHHCSQDLYTVHFLSPQSVTLSHLSQCSSSTSFTQDTLTPHHPRPPDQSGFSPVQDLCEIL